VMTLWSSEAHRRYQSIGGSNPSDPIPRFCDPKTARRRRVRRFQTGDIIRRYHPTIGSRCLTSVGYPDITSEQHSYIGDGETLQLGLDENAASIYRGRRSRQRKSAIAVFELNSIQSGVGIGLVGNVAANTTTLYESSSYFSSTISKYSSSINRGFCT